MSKPFNFSEFYSQSATVQTPTETTDDLMGVSKSWATRTAVGTSGVIAGSLQSAGGTQQEMYAKSNMSVDYVFYADDEAANFGQITNGDRLSISGNNYQVVHREDEGGTGETPLLLLRRIE